MKHYLKTQNLKTLPRMNLQLPSLTLVCLGLFFTSPLMLTGIVNGTLILPSGLAVAANLMLDRYVCRALLTAGFVVQNRSRAIAAVPLALVFISQAVERIIQLLCGLPGSLYLSSQTRAQDFVIRLHSYFQKINIEINACVQTSLFAVHLVDDLWWRDKPTAVTL